MTERRPKRAAAAMLLAAASLAVAAPTVALAHHSFAMFDRDKRETLKGTVKEFQWTNPHAFIQLLVPNGQGGADEWSIEAGPPNMLYRQGWDNKTFKPGDQVTVVVSPLRRGGRGGSFLSAILANGKSIGDPNTRLPG